MNVAIITARAGSKSIIDKNILEVRSHPLVFYPIKAALDSVSIDRVFISTDGEGIAKAGEEHGAIIIPRPDELGGDTINHGDVIKHAVEWVDKRYEDLENVVLLLGNTVYVDGAIIDKCLQKLDDEPELDSCMTVWEAQDDHPLRAMEISEDGFLRPYGNVERKVSTERQSYSKAYYYDQGVWAFRKHTVQSQDGPNPWWWMGKKSAPILRTWVTGRDIHTYFDVGVSEWYLDNLDAIRKLLAASSENGF